jgi:hypothetical protein
MDNDLEKIIGINTDAEHLIYVEGNEKYKIITATGQKINFDGSVPQDKPEVDEDDVAYIKDESGYTASDNIYTSYLDMINGRGEGEKSMIEKRGGGSKNGVTVINHNGNTVGNNYLILSGWCVVDGGVAKYVWSADGGATWNDVELMVYGSLSHASPEVVNVANNYLGSAFEAEKITQAMLQGAPNLPDPLGVAGIGADLSDYVGKTVDVTFAAIPETAQDTLCVIVHVTGVTVP